MRIIRAADYRVMPWKNGGGSTTEIGVFPPDAPLDSFEWRISMAHVGSDGPFSGFPGIDRTLAVLAGAGIALVSAEAGAVMLDRDAAPYAFPGERAITGRLSDGPIDDLNVMTRRGRWRHRVERLSGASALTAREGLLVLIAHKRDWLMNGASLPAGDSAFLDAPGRVALVADGDAAELYAVWLTPAQ